MNRNGKLHGSVACVGLALLLSSSTASRSCAAEAIESAPRVQASQVITPTGPAERPPVFTALAVAGNTIAVGGDDHLIRLWRQDGDQPESLLRGHHDWARTAAISPAGKILATAGNDRRVLIWDLSEGHLLSELAAGEQAIADLDFSPDGRRLAAAGFERSLAIYDVATGRLLRQLECPGRDNRCVAFSPDGSRLAVGGRNGVVRIFDGEGDGAPADLPGHRRRVRGLTFSADSQRLVTAAEDARIVVWDLARGEAHAAIDGPAKFHALALVDRGRVATGDGDNVVRLWNPTTRQLEVELIGHTGTITQLAYDAATRRLYSASYDTTVRVWDLSRLDERTTAALPSVEAGRPSAPRSR